MGLEFGELGEEFGLGGCGAFLVALSQRFLQLVHLTKMEYSFTCDICNTWDRLHM